MNINTLDQMNKRHASFTKINKSNAPWRWLRCRAARTLCGSLLFRLPIMPSLLFAVRTRFVLAPIPTLSFHALHKVSPMYTPPAMCQVEQYIVSTLSVLLLALRTTACKSMPSNSVNSQQLFHCLRVTPAIRS